jgi:sulfur carrier protein
MILVKINGDLREFREPTRLVDFLEEYGLGSQFVAVAYNGDVVEKSDYSQVVLKNGDVVELVRPVGGGSVTE